jgi:hypothetical protein
MSKLKPEAFTMDRAQYMSDELKKLSSDQLKKFFYILNTDHDLKFEEILLKAKEECIQVKVGKVKKSTANTSKFERTHNKVLSSMERGDKAQIWDCRKYLD